jgi:hypothetical protein
MTLTLQIIRDHSPCATGWKTLTQAIDSDLTTELSIGDVLISNGLDDALWCLQCLEPRVRVAAIMPAVKRAAVHIDDKRVHDCIADIDTWLAGDDTVDLAAAEAESWSAAEAAEVVSWSVAEVAVAAAQAAALRAAQAAQAAAGAAAGAAAWAAAGEAMWAAAEAEEAAGASWEAVEAEASWAAERKLQEADLLAMFPPMILKGDKP